MKQLDISEQEQSEIFSILAGILFMTNLPAAGVEEVEVPILDTERDEPLALSQKDSLANAAFNFGVDKDALNALMVTFDSVRKAFKPKTSKLSRRGFRGGTGKYHASLGLCKAQPH